MSKETNRDEMALKLARLSLLFTTFVALGILLLQLVVEVAAPSKETKVLMVVILIVTLAHLYKKIWSLLQTLIQDFGFVK